MAWVAPNSNPLPWAGMPFTRPGCSNPALHTCIPFFSTSNPHLLITSAFKHKNSFGFPRLLTRQLLCSGTNMHVTKSQPHSNSCCDRTLSRHPLSGNTSAPTSSGFGGTKSGTEPRLPLSNAAPPGSAESRDRAHSLACFVTPDRPSCRVQ